MKTILNGHFRMKSAFTVYICISPFFLHKSYITLNGKLQEYKNCKQYDVLQVN